MTGKIGIFREVVALVMVIAALTPLTLPLMGSFFAPKETGEIVVRMYVQESGGFDPDVIRVKKGEPIKLILMSMDVPHGFAIEELGINTGPVIDKTVIEFTPEEEGVYEFFCPIECSSLHYYMRGTLIVKD